MAVCGLRTTRIPRIRNRHSPPQIILSRALPAYTAYIYIYIAFHPAIRYRSSSIIIVIVPEYMNMNAARKGGNDRATFCEKQIRLLSNYFRNDSIFRIEKSMKEEEILFVKRKKAGRND